MEKIWIGVGNSFDLNSGTYEIQKSEKDVKILSLFENIKTLKDIEDNLDYLYEHIESPTSCYFDVDKSSGLFYCDQQGCVLWYLKKDGKVYTDDNVMVADSLPEFLSHIYSDSKKFYERREKYMEMLFGD